MKKRKKKKLRNKFTDALGEEISSRKELDLEKRLQAKVDTTPKVDLTKKFEPQPAPITDTKVDEIKIEPVPKTEIVEVKVDAEFEERVLAEADSDFLEKKIKRPRRLAPESKSSSARQTFRAKMIQERIEEEKAEEAENKKSSDKDADLHRKLTRAETAGAVIAVVMLIYSLATYDKPLFFLSMALISHILRPLIGSFFGEYNRPVQNALHGFSIALFFGALLFLFI